MSPVTIVLREEPCLLVNFLEYNNIYLLATDEGSTALIGTFSKPRLRWQRRRGKKKKDQMCRTIAQNVCFKTVYIS